MFKNYLVTAVRNLKRNWSFTMINIIGLAIAMAITIVSLLYITNEFSYDRFHAKNDRIYRVILKSESNTEGTTTSSIATAGIGPTLLGEIPEVESMVRLSNPAGCFLSYNENNYPAHLMMYADSAFFTLFSFNLILGNEKNVLAKPFTTVLTRSFALKMFEDENEAIGKIVRLNNKDNLLVTGIAEDPPVQSHLQFDMLVSFATLYEDPQMYLGWDGGHNYYTYILLQDNAKIEQVEERLPPVLEKNINEKYRQFGASWSLLFQPLKRVHMFSDFDADISTRGNLRFVFILLTITLFVLFIACINFINLTTAAALSRMKEVGVRKVVGATRGKIIGQFMTETVLMSIISLILAFFIVEVVQTFYPYFVQDSFLLEQIMIFNSSFYQIAGVMVFVLIFVGLVAGGYPAYFMSRFQTVRVLKGHLSGTKSKPVFRSMLIIFQFAVSSVLILCTLIIVTQINYLLKQDLGFNPPKKIVIPLTSESSKESYEVLESGFKSIAGVKSVGASSDIPGRGFTRNGYLPEGLSEPIMIHVLDIDYDYLNTMGLKIVDGRNFSKESGTDKDAFLINQTLAKQLGWENAIGKTIKRGGRHKVIGVVEDFHYYPLHKRVEPLIITLRPWRGYDFITVNYTQSNDKELIRQLEEKWYAVSPYEDFDYFFLNDYIRRAYNQETGFAWILASCSGLALFIAGLGLFGLAAFITRQRSREMAIRKVFGAGIRKIFMLVSSGFLKWVLIANIIAIPVAWFIMDKWLQYFAYHGGMRLWIFLATIVFCLLLALVIILFQILRLSRLNPIDFIRYE